VKLCRFCLPDDAVARAGIFHDGKVYETDGASALGVHSPDSVRLLAPVGHVGSLRLFGWGGDDFVYANSGSMIGADGSFLFSRMDSAGCDVFLACVLGGSDRDCSIAEASALILGYSILLGFSDGGGLYGPGFALGPFVVTPDEVSSFAGLRCRLRLGDEVVASAEASMALGFEALVSAASRGGDLREGDVFAVGPVPGLSLPRQLRDGDGVVAVVEHLGALGAFVRE